MKGTSHGLPGNSHMLGVPTTHILRDMFAIDVTAHPSIKGYVPYDDIIYSNQSIINTPLRVMCFHLIPPIFLYFLSLELLSSGGSVLSCLALHVGSFDLVLHAIGRTTPYSYHATFTHLYTYVKSSPYEVLT